MPTSGQGSEVIKIIIPIVILALAFTFIAFIVCIIIWRKIRGNGGNTPRDELEEKSGDTIHLEMKIVTVLPCKITHSYTI